VELTPLAPLQASAEFWDDIDETSIESELKQLFIALFENFLRTKFRRIDSYGYPHLLDEDDFETIERFVKLDGLSLLNRETNNQPYMREVFRAWRGQHQRRGLGFLEFYLQMLWPDAWKIKQQYHPIATENNYPANITLSDLGNSFLTSRVSVFLDPTQLTNSNEIPKMIPSLKRVVPARIVLNVAIGISVEPVDMNIGMAFTPTLYMSLEDGAVV
jgi:hypothetical protein